MITSHAWDAAGKCIQQIQAAELMSRRDEWLSGKSALWIDLSTPTEEEEQLVFGQFFPVHTLSFEDITRLRREPHSPPHHPKVEEFRDYLFVVFNPLADALPDKIMSGEDRSVSLTQLSAVMTHNVLITHHMTPLRSIDGVSAFIQRHEAQIERGPDYLFHLILDRAVDEFAPALDAVEATLEQLETTILRHPRQVMFVRLLRLKRVIIVLRKTLIAQRELLVRLVRGEFALVDEREMVYYRNVYDHLVRFTELIESSREMVTDLMQTYLSAQSNHLSQIMKVLTMISTIVLPMTLIAGVYGMNFKKLNPDIDNEWGFLTALGMMLVSGLVGLGFFWWRRWL
jgi:magnesium transporter